jgi:dienelactone hydrolase
VAIFFACILLACSSLQPSPAEAYSFRVMLPILDSKNLPAYCFLPDYEIRQRLAGVVCGVGVGSTKILQYHTHCQMLANKGFFVVLIDPSNFPEQLTPGPFSWDRMPGKLVADMNQVIVAGKLLFGYEWYLRAILAAVNYLYYSPLVDPGKIAISGFSQPANAALTYACRDPRIKAIVWNYGGSPWILPYDPYKLPPVLIFHGTDDEVYDVKYAHSLAAELGSHNRDYEAHIYPGQRHMFNVRYELESEDPTTNPIIMDSFRILISFLYRKLFFADILTGGPGRQHRR